ncbi:MAG: glycoside hydrolase [Bradymonadaceae bacterium]
MASQKKLVQFIWHLHQPYYSVPDRPSNLLPWVRLHAVKAYYDMGRMLERFPDVRCVTNFSGSLIRQIHEYVEEGKRDTWWDLTLKPAALLSAQDKGLLLKHFFSVNWETCIRPLPRYWQILQKRGTDPGKARVEDFSTEEWRDLQVLFNVAWFGFSARDEFELLQGLIAKGSEFTESEKEEVLRLQIHIMQTLLPMYRRLHERGQIEVSVTPMYHPILPLVIDSDVASRATPERPRPPRFHAPDDARFHVREGLRVAREMFGIEVVGMWPSEGSVSPEVIELFNEEGVAWVASDEDVLHRSLGSRWSRQHDLYRPWRLRGKEGPFIFFRDHGLSDQIGFAYSKNAPKAAVGDLLARIRGVPSVDHAKEPLVSIILDGENPWEHYPEDGKHFLELLYTRLSEVKDIETTFPKRYLETHSNEGVLDTIHSGSWILGNYQIWIGHAETNRGWELLGKARRALMEATEGGAIEAHDLKRAWEALYIAEGSDWFWWYGDDFSSDHDADFDRLFRAQLRYIYAALGQEAPADVELPISTGRSSEVIYSAPQSLIRPTIDGKSEYFYEWSGAALYRNTGAHGAMFETTRFVETIRLGFDLKTLYGRLDPGPDLHEDRRDLQMRLRIRTPGGDFQVEIAMGSKPTATLIRADSDQPAIELEVARADSVEFAVPLEALGISTEDEIQVSVGIWDDATEVERHPLEGSLTLIVPDASFDLRHWMV